MQRLLKTKSSVILMTFMLISLMILLGMSVSAETYSGKCGDGLTWELDEATGELEIFGTGDMYDYTNTELPEWAPYADSIKHVVVGDEVTSIGDYAFKGCSNLSNVELGDSVARIGDFAFDDSQVYKIYLPLSIKEIGEHPLSKMDWGMCTLNYPGTKKQWDEITVRISDYYLNYITISCQSGAVYYGKCGDDAFWRFSIHTGTFEVFGSGEMCPYSIYPMDMPWWRYRSEIDKIIIGDSITHISLRAFYGCGSLKELVVGESVKYINMESFYKCSALRNVYLPSSLEYISYSAFEECWSLRYVEYDGTDKQWSEIDIERGNELLTGADISYNNFPFEGKCGDDLRWSFDCESGRLEIKGSGRMYDYDPEENPVPWEHTKPYMKTVYLGRGITYLGSGAFVGCEQLSEFRFAGYEEEWNAIEIGINNDSVTPDILEFEYFSGKCGDDLTWNIDGIAGELCISGTGDMYDYDNTDNIAPWREHCDRITSIVIGDSVTSIGTNAFNNLGDIFSLVMGDSVSEIRNNAFFNGISIMGLYVKDLSSWCNIDFHNSTSNPLNYTENFYVDGKMQTKLVIPESVKVIKECAFFGFKNLRSVIIGDSVTEIGSDAFISCPSLESVSIGNSVEKIGDSAFSWCYSLKGVDIPDSVVSIGDYAFAYCNALGFVNFGSSLTTIGIAAFEGSNFLESVVIPDSVTEIGEMAFANCKALSDVTIPDSVESMGYIIVNNTSYFKNEDNWTGDLLYVGNHLVGSRRTISGEHSVREGTLTIADDIFLGCRALTKLYIPRSVIYIGDLTFDGCDIIIKCYNDSYAYNYSISKGIEYEFACDHIFTDYIPDNNGTCVSDGTKTAYCDKGCGETDSIVNEGSVTGIHKYGDWVVSVRATYVSEGEDIRYCIYCDAAETQKTPVLTLKVTSDDLIMTVNCAEHIKDMRYALGRYTTAAEIKKAEGNVAISNAIVQKYTKDGLFIYEMTKTGYYTLWIRMTDGTEHILGIEINIMPTVTSKGVTVTLHNLYNVKDFFIAKGEYQSYSEIKKNGYIFSAGAAKIGDSHEYTYTVYEPGVHTILVRYNNGTSVLLHETLTVTEPLFTANGLEVTVSQLFGVKVIRTAYGEWNTVSELKAADRVRNFTATHDIKNQVYYTFSFPDEGPVTVIVEYNNGYKKVFHYDAKITVAQP